MLPWAACSVIEEELRGIAREVKRQQAPRRPAIPLPRAASRPALAAAARRQTSGANGGSGAGAALRRQGSYGLAAALRRQGSSAGAAAPVPRQPSTSSFPLQRQASAPEEAAGEQLPAVLAGPAPAEAAEHEEEEEESEAEAAGTADGGAAGQPVRPVGSQGAAGEDGDGSAGAETSIAERSAAAAQG